MLKPGDLVSVYLHPHRDLLFLGVFLEIEPYEGTEFYNILTAGGGMKYVPVKHGKKYEIVVVSKND